MAYIDPGTIYTVGSGLAGVLAVLLSFFGFVAVFFRRVFAWLKRHWLVVTLGVVALAGIATALLIVGKGKGTTVIAKGPASRFIIIGLDGLSPELVEPWLAAGKLPSFAKLKESGSYARIATTNPSESPVAWAGFATGRNPGTHGVYDFIRRSPGSYLPDLSLTRLEGNHSLPVRKGKAFWSYGRETGVPVAILACPVTFPPDEVNGTMLSGMGTPDLLGTQGTFSFYTTAPETVTAETGGEVHAVADGNPLKLELYGPRKQGLTGKVERLTAPFQVRVNADRSGATISLAGEEVTLSVGHWSGWLDVAFKVGPIKKMHGIVRFNLVALQPHLQLYASPICIDPRTPWFPISYPPEYARKLASELGLYSTRGMPFDTWALNEARLSEDAFIEDAENLYEERLRLLEHELGRFERGVFFCYFDYPDIIQHMYWRFIDTEHPLYDPSAPPKLKGMIEECYQKMDHVVGKVLAQARPGDTVVVLSDHGFGTWRRAAHINSWLKQNGYMVLRNPLATEGGPLFSDVEWSRTRAYALGFGGIYLNRVGREPKGIVAPAEATSLAREIRDRLQTWTDGKTGAKVAHAVYLQDEIFHGPDAVLAPDLYVGFSAGYGASWQTALGAAPAGDLVVDSVKKWGGTHLVDPSLVPGVLFCNRPIAKANPSLYDLAPTVLRFMALDDARLATEDLDGKPLW
jgi:predicted AlkP superfamily phosphohydrolase/phosphomutase